MHLQIVFDCRDDIIISSLGRNVAHIENNGIGDWPNANLNGHGIYRIWNEFSFHTVFMKTSCVFLYPWACGKGI